MSSSSGPALAAGPVRAGCNIPERPRGERLLLQGEWLGFGPTGLPPVQQTGPARITPARRRAYSAPAMKSHSSFQSARRALIVTSLSLLVGAGTALAQSQGSKDYSSSSSSSNGTSTGSNSYGSSASGNRDTTSTTSTTGAMNNSGAKLGFMDKRFVTKAAEGGQAEVQIAQLAASQASSADVKSFAQKLVSDHTAVNQELMSLASSKGVTLDKDDGQDRAYKRLAKKSGADFDREFVEHMIDDHEKDIKMFEKASTDAKDMEVRNFAAKHLADLRSHLTQAQSLRASVMPTGRDSENSGRADYGTSATPSSSTSSSTAPSSSTPKSTTPNSTTDSSSTSGSSTTKSGTK